MAAVHIKQIALYVTPSQHRELRLLSSRTRVPMQAYLRQAIEDLLSKHKDGAPAPAGVKGAESMKYLTKIPRSVSAGQVVVHNNVRPSKRLGNRGFRAWMDQYNDAKYELCPCAWATDQLPEHYRMRGVAHDR